MKITIESLQYMHQHGEKISMLTCYDASFARVMDSAGVELLLVGDSLGMVIQDHASTLPVSVDDIVYHTRCVARAAGRAMVVSDMPFGSYQESPQQAFANAARFMQAGANMVKLEGGSWVAQTVRFLVERGIPVCAHIGLTPQFVNVLSGFKVQGKTEGDAERLLLDAKVLSEAGASLIVIECVPTVLAKRIAENSAVPTIGIGAGREVSGQVLVMHDMLGLMPGKKLRFVKNFMEGRTSIAQAFEAYVHEVKKQIFPADEHCF